MFLINPFDAVVYGIPQNDFAVHTARSHKMQLRNRYHVHYHHSMPLSVIPVLLQWFLRIRLQIPQHNRPILQTAKQYFIQTVPDDAVNLFSELMLHKLLLVVWLRGKNEPSGCGEFPTPHKSIASCCHQQMILVIIYVKHI